MFDQAFENLRKATETTVQLQQEMFKKWAGAWPGGSSSSAWGDQVYQFEKKWMDSMGDLFAKQRETLETQFKAGMQNIEKAFQIGEAKSPEELRAKTMEMWQKCFESLRQTYETQVRDFQATLQKLSGLLTPVG